MQEYGQFLSEDLGDATLMLQLDFSQLPGSPSKETLLVRTVQIGIDLAGVADNGGFWPSNGGHHMGRKWPILLAGTVLGDAHMSDVGQWSTKFQEDDDTFYVSQAEVDMTHSGAWDPDNRAPPKPYETGDIGIPEWGIRHTDRPEQDNFHWEATYRNMNMPGSMGFVLAAQLMGKKAEWNHDALFDFYDRAAALEPISPTMVFPGDFQKEMWNTYRASHGGPRWLPNDTADLYSQGAPE